MSYSVFLLVVMWLSLTAYALLAGADFGAGILDLFAGRTRAGASRRALIEHVIGPVWEANHVWLIFVLVLLWTAFAPVFAAVASTLYIPLTLVALGIIGRGSAFAFRKAATTMAQRRAFGATFALSSLATPYFLGACAGGIASDRVPAGIAAGSVSGSWLNPTSVVTGILAVLACAYLAAVYLAGEAAARGQDDLAQYFRRRALLGGALAGAASAAGLAVVALDAPAFADGLLRGSGLPWVIVAGVTGCAALVFMATRRYTIARITAGGAVAAVVWGWGVAQYPTLLPGVSVGTASAPAGTLQAMTVVVSIGLVLLVPSLFLLLRLFNVPSTR